MLLVSTATKCIWFTIVSTGRKHYFTKIFCPSIYEAVWHEYLTEQCVFGSCQWYYFHLQIILISIHNLITLDWHTAPLCLNISVCGNKYIIYINIVTVVTLLLSWCFRFIFRSFFYPPLSSGIIDLIICLRCSGSVTQYWKFLLQRFGFGSCSKVGLVYIIGCNSWSLIVTSSWL